MKTAIIHAKINLRQELNNVMQVNFSPAISGVLANKMICGIDLVKNDHPYSRIPDNLLAKFHKPIRYLANLPYDK